MTTAPDLVVAGDRGLSRKLRGTGRFRTVFDVATATQLRELSESGQVRPPSAFVFGPEFEENLPGAGVSRLAGDLAARGATVVVHGFFTERGDRFGPGVTAISGPVALSELMAMLGAPEPAADAAGDAEPDLLPEPPPEPWALPATLPTTPLPDEPVTRPDLPDPVQTAPEPPDPGDAQMPDEPVTRPDLPDLLKSAPEPPDAGDAEEPPQADEAPEPPPPATTPEPKPDLSVAPTDKLVASWRTSRQADTGREPDADPSPVNGSPTNGSPQDAVPVPVAAPAPDAGPVPFDGVPGAPAEPPPASGWENLTGWSWDETAPEPGDTYDPHEAAGLAGPGAPGPRGGGRRRPVLAAAVAILVLAGAAIGVTTLTAGSGNAGPPAAESSPPAPSPARSSEAPTPEEQTTPAKPSRSPSPAPTKSLTPVRQFAPGQVRIVDGRISINVSWTDRTGGKGSHYIVGGPTGRPPSTLASASPGTSKITVTALNPSVDYCLTVVAVMDVDRVSQAEPVCTHRVPRRG